MLYVRQISEKFFIATDVYIFMLPYVECTVQMKLEHVLVQRSKKIEMEEKNISMFQREQIPVEE